MCLKLPFPFSTVHVVTDRSASKCSDRIIAYEWPGRGLGLGYKFILLPYCYLGLVSLLNMCGNLDLYYFIT
jgi:hypothetical protein